MMDIFLKLHLKTMIKMALFQLKFLQISWWCTMNLALRIANPKSIYHLILSILKITAIYWKYFYNLWYQIDLFEEMKMELLCDWYPWWITTGNVVLSHWICWEYLTRKRFLLRISHEKETVKMDLRGWETTVSLMNIW